MTVRGCEYVEAKRKYAKYIDLFHKKLIGCAICIQNNKVGHTMPDLPKS